jgi:hypothetical protein
MLVEYALRSKKSKIMVFHPADFGGKWIRPKKRYQIYKRDGFKCIYCQCEFNRFFTLDHIKITSEGMDNSPANLVTCCKRCNSVRSSLSIEKFMIFLVREHNQKPAEVRKRMIRSKYAALPEMDDPEVQALAKFLAYRPKEKK